MIIFFGTVIRTAPVRLGGHLVRLDWSTKTVEAEVPVFPTDPDLDDDPNPRGNSRGCRGIEVIGDRVVAATYHTLAVYDRQLRHERNISHGLMAGIHETCRDAHGRIWVSSTAIDAAIAYELDQTGPITPVEALWPRSQPGLQETLGVTASEVDPDADNRRRYLGPEHVRHPSHLHLNAVAEWNGEMYGLLHKFAAICNLTRGTVVVRDPALKGGHNLLITDDGTAISNDTYGRTVRFYDVTEGRLVDTIDLTSFPWVRSLARRALVSRMLRLRLATSKTARPLFVRGLDRADDLLFVGLSPAAIVAVDWKRKTLVDAYRHSTDVHMCVHGLAVG